jgi:hypothetical protein
LNDAAGCVSESTSEEQAKKPGPERNKADLVTMRAQAWKIIGVLMRLTGNRYLIRNAIRITFFLRVRPNCAREQHAMAVCRQYERHARPSTKSHERLTSRTSLLLYRQPHGPRRFQLKQIDSGPCPCINAQARQRFICKRNGSHGPGAAWSYTTRIQQSPQRRQGRLDPAQTENGEADPSPKHSKHSWRESSLPDSAGSSRLSEPW